MSYYTIKPGVYPDVNLKNTEDQFYGSGWDVKKTGEKYLLSYISGALQGESKTHEISKADFEAAKRGEIDLAGLCAKYQIF